MNNKRLIILLDDIQLYKEEIKFNKELDWYLRVEMFRDLLLTYEEIKRETTPEFWSAFYKYPYPPMDLWIPTTSMSIYLPFVL